MTAFDVTVLGSANLDLVVRTERIPSPGETVLGSAYAEHLGGKGLNQAVAAARSGARTAFIGALGTDAAGQMVRDALAAERISAEDLQVVKTASTGRALVTVDHHGENSIVVVPGANHLLLALGRLRPTRVVLAQLEIPIGVLASVFAAARAQGAITILNPAPAADLDDHVLSLCDVLVPNEHEVELLGGVAGLLARGVSTVVVTRGGAGVDAYTSSGRVHQAPFSVDPVDTTGAGDAFCGAFAMQIAQQGDLSTALRWGAAAGALATTVPGAVPSLPHRNSVMNLLG
jgi:ribokinase